MTDRNRAARLLALLAGNGFVLSKIYESVMSDVPHFDPSTSGVIQALSIWAFLGATGAYVALWRPERLGWIGERVAILGVVGGMAAWLGYIHGLAEAMEHAKR